MRFTSFAVASIAVLSTLGFSVPQTHAKSLSNRHQDFRPDVSADKPQRRAVCEKRSTKKKSSTRKSTTTSKASVQTPVQAAAKVTSSKSSSSSISTRSTASASKTSSASSSARSTASASKTSSASSSSSTSLYSLAGQAPPKSPWGNCFDLTATAFQPNWKGEATTTWCGVNFDKTSPILALPLADLSKAYGSNTSVTYYSNETLWNQMIADWCGREVWVQGPGGMFKAYFGDANEWTSVDLNMNLYTKVQGVPTGSYVDPDAARWMSNIKGCFTGNQISIKNGYPMSY
ncbi:hypothetical protein PHBOTO_001504 [Pseudozyma hubeiensis]|nr:hypothetical protein PHBOTO_001504 [Pseudozyma hubeiensis]